ncbi:MAG TPA: MFS transporter [Bacteroidota bacterium]|nr:MFS transporter [Bacteroidota bacterium]
MIPEAQDSRPGYILPIIVLSQFAGTSLWFATNAVLPDLRQAWQLPAETVGYVTSAVQLGFIIGTLVFAVLTISDRYSPRLLFFISSLIGSGLNLCIYLFAEGFPSLLVLRFLTGVCLAGIYPVGMKIASGWYREGLGTALGFLVGALVVGTSFPHLLRSFTEGVHWQSVIIAVSCISLGGGVLMLMFVPDGPNLVPAPPLSAKALPLIYSSKELRAAAFGYFGHMWELYTFYAFVPLMLTSFIVTHPQDNIDVSLWSFLIIAAGGLGCAGGGILARRLGSARMAFVFLLISGLCCLFSPLFFELPKGMFLGLFCLWGIVVVGDSPQFSALIAGSAPQGLVGSALTVGNSIGFAITIISIEAVSYLSHFISPERVFLVLAIGPASGLFALRPLLKKPVRNQT